MPRFWKSVVMVVAFFQASAQEVPDTVVMRFGGDVLLAGHYETAVGESCGRAFDGFDLFHTDDVSMVNLECPITSRGTKVSKPYNFRMKPAFVEALPGAGIDIVNLANNHIFDYGKEGLFDTISYLDSAGVLHVGAGRDQEEARGPVVLSIKGRRIGFLGYYGGGEAPVAQGTRCGVAPRSLDVIEDEIHALHVRNSVEYIVVTLHWGMEKAESPDAALESFAHRVIDAGADAVIGHHPHVLQGIERYKQGVIVYSLGNLVFGGNSRDTYDTALFEIRLQQEGPAYRVIPLRVESWKVRELVGEEGSRVCKGIEKLSSKFNSSIFTMKEKP
jgi:poly-gamma-glutamate capsule biosynthesis protein CapA/YwtB (metallophosphatase superfamily)